jgi:acetyl-CoA carboxylase carboxyl transferase subunit alpha
MTTNFVELYGDRNVRDDKAMVGGFASLDGQTVMIIGQQKASIRRQDRCEILEWRILKGTGRLYD